MRWFRGILGPLPAPGVCPPPRKTPRIPDFLAIPAARTALRSRRRGYRTSAGVATASCGALANGTSPYG